MIKHSKYWYDYNRNDLSRKNPFNEVKDDEQTSLPKDSPTLKNTEKDND